VAAGSLRSQRLSSVRSYHHVPLKFQLYQQRLLWDSCNQRPRYRPDTSTNGRATAWQQWGQRQLAPRDKAYPRAAQILPAARGSEGYPQQAPYKWQQYRTTPTPPTVVATAGYARLQSATRRYKYNRSTVLPVRLGAVREGGSPTEPSIYEGQTLGPHWPTWPACRARAHTTSCAGAQ
jgi:hypothetical protein